MRGPDDKIGHAEPENQFYGDRAAAFTDPFGHRWHIASHLEDVSRGDGQADERDGRLS
ncbi:MAG TPA: hypothetical protein VGP04_23455 [Pseudonocardiaceae bacterium]|nr:hypothetical protein [Pseudonocardiaceae bacterium]